MSSPCPTPFPPLYVDLYAGLCRALASPWLEPWWLDGQAVAPRPARPAPGPVRPAAVPNVRQSAGAGPPPRTDDRERPAEVDRRPAPPAWRVIEGLDSDPVAARDLADLRRMLRAQRRRRRSVA